jgi:hypothetical protein
MIALPLNEMSRAEKLMAMEALWADLSQDEQFLESPPGTCKNWRRPKHA